MTTYPYVTVIVPAHQEEAQIAQTLDSLVRQQKLPFQVLVVANGCSDHTVKIARFFVDKFPPGTLGVIETKERGIGYACNQGAQFATGDIIAIVEADTTVSANTIDCIAQAIQQGYIGGTIKLTPKERKLRYLLMQLACELQYGADWGPVRFCTTEIYEKIGGHREGADFGVDGDFARRVQEQGPVVYIAEAQCQTSMRRYERLGIGEMIRDGVRYTFGRIFKGKSHGAYPVVR